MVGSGEVGFGKVRFGFRFKGGGTITQQEVLKLLQDGISRTLNQIDKELNYSHKNSIQACIRLERWGYIISFYEPAILKDGSHHRIKKVMICRE